jgi:hypothetical protein
MRLIGATYRIGNRATKQFRQLRRRECQAKVGVAIAHNRQREAANLPRQPMIAGVAAPLRDRLEALSGFQATQKSENLTPP